MTRTSLNTAYLLLTGVVIVAVVVFVMVLQPMMASISATRQRTAETENELNQKKKFLNTLERKQSVLRTQQAHENMLAIALPTDEAFDDVVRILHRAAGASGGIVTSVENSSVESQRDAAIRQSQNESSSVPSSVLPLTASVQFRGSYQQFRLFLEQLEKAPRLIDIDSMKVEAEQGLDRVIARFDVTVYTFKVPNLLTP
jgi:Tfp pilus assembly protein PilO